MCHSPLVRSCRLAVFTSVFVAVAFWIQEQDGASCSLRTLVFVLLFETHPQTSHRMDSAQCNAVFCKHWVEGSQDVIQRAERYGGGVADAIQESNPLLQAHVLHFEGYGFDAKGGVQKSVEAYVRSKCLERVFVVILLGFNDKKNVDVRILTRKVLEMATIGRSGTVFVVPDDGLTRQEAIVLFVNI